MYCNLGQCNCHSSQACSIIDLFHVSFIHRLLYESHEEGSSVTHGKQLTLQTKAPHVPELPPFRFSLLVPAAVGVAPVTLAEGAEQEVSPGGGPRLHRPAFSIPILRSHLSQLGCSFHRRWAERDPRERAAADRAPPGGVGWSRSRAC